MSKVRFDIGTESFPELIENGAYYVDKTKYLKDLFLGYENAKTPIFIRPRRFGKTLNMSMIKSFCEINYQVSAHTPTVECTFQGALGFFSDGGMRAVWSQSSSLAL